MSKGRNENLISCTKLNFPITESLNIYCFAKDETEKRLLDSYSDLKGKSRNSPKGSSTFLDNVID